MGINTVLIDELLKDYSTPEEIIGKDGLLKHLTKALLERCMDREMKSHLGYDKHSVTGNNSGNSRNGYSKKKLITDHGEMDIAIPRDRNGKFDPQIIEKGQRRFTGFDDKILSMYALGMSTRDIKYHLKDIYSVEVSAELISNVTEGVVELVKEWQERPLLPLYAIVYFDALWVKVRDGNRVINKAVYVAMGVDIDGNKDVLGLWIDQSEGAKFWLKVISEIQSRGVEDILIACVDGLKGFPEAIEAIFPHTSVQVCIVHMIRNSMKYISRKKYREFIIDLKKVYKAINEDSALSALEELDNKWGESYPTVISSWRNNWTQLSVMFQFPEAIRKLIYTTNPIESLNASLRKVTKNKRVFPSDKAAFKQLYFAVKKKVESWKGGVNGWREISNQLSILFPERIKNAFTQKK